MFLAEVPYNSFYFNWEISLEEWIQATFSDGVINAISQLSIFGETVVMVVVLGLIYWGLNKEFGRYVGISICVANVLNPFIKNMFIRRRPYFESDGIDLKRLVEPDADKYDIAAQGYSFPSGHSMCSATLFGAMAVYMKKRWMTVLAFLLPLLVGISRVVVGAHYPTDVLVGWAMGVCVIFLIPYLQKKAPSENVFNAILAVVFATGFFFCTSDDYFTAYGMLLGYIFSVPFEKKYVNFENTKNPVRVILRVACGGALYVVINSVLKLPFSAEFLNSATLAAHLVRTVRYAVVIFLILAVYPMVFKVGDKIFKK